MSSRDGAVVEDFSYVYKGLHLREHIMSEVGWDGHTVVSG